MSTFPGAGARAVLGAGNSTEQTENRETWAHPHLSGEKIAPQREPVDGFIRPEVSGSSTLWCKGFGPQQQPQHQRQPGFPVNNQ